jgi:hypothetical protein
MPPFEDTRGAFAARGRGKPSAHRPDASVGPAVAEEEPDAWARVLRSWNDEAAHRAYLDRLLDLEGLAVAGGRYRAVLARRPDDPFAMRHRDEIVKRATVQGLALLPKVKPPRWSPRTTKRLAYLLSFALVAAFGWLASRYFLPGAAP